MKNPKIIFYSSIRDLFSLISLGLSLGVAQLSQIVIGTTDTIMLGSLGGNELAAGSLVNSIIIVFVLFGSGTLQALNPLMGAAFGRKNKFEIILIFRNSLLIATTCTLPLIIIAFMMKPILTLFHQDPLLISVASQYSLYLIPGFIPIFWLIPIHIYLITVSDRRQILQFSLLGIVLNLFLNYLLMFDSLGISGLGIRGCALSTSITNVSILVLALISVMTRESAFIQRLLSTKFRPSVIFSILKLGIPIGFVILSETLILTIASLMMGSISRNVLAAFSISIQLLAIVYMIPIGFSNALTSKISFELGQQNSRKILQLIYCSIFVVLIYLISISIAFILFQDRLILMIYREANSRIHEIASSFIYYVIIIQILNGLIVILAGILRGFRETKSPLIIVFFIYWVLGCTLMYFLKMYFREYGVWIAIISSYSLAFIGISIEVKNKITNLSYIIKYITRKDSQILSE